MNFFFISKPVQYFNVLNVIGTLNNKFEKENNTLLISDDFSESKRFYEKVRKVSRLWRTTKYFQSRIAAFIWLILNVRDSNVYIDSDYAKDSLFVKLLLFRGNQVSLYEEGIFTYKDDLFAEYLAKHKKKIAIYKFLKLPKSIGITPGLSNIYVYSKSRFIARRPECKLDISLFKYSFTENYISNKRELDLIFNINKEVLSKDFDVIYCGPKDPSDIVNLTHLKTGNILFKPHPACDFKDEEYNQLLGNSNVIILHDNIPIEILCMKVIKKNKPVFYHHNCSAELYLKDMVKEFVNLDLHNK